MATHSNISNGTGSQAEQGHQPLSPEQLYSLVAILSIFSITGTVGNAIAFYVFSNLKKQKLTSTIFILALAGTDFITCLITIPFTITTEIVDFHLQVDFFCKFYHFLITTTVPFSAFVMVVIAVDRFLCICHPFLHWMTERRAKIIITCLAIFIFCIGGIISAHYSIYKQDTFEITPKVDGLDNVTKAHSYDNSLPVTNNSSLTNSTGVMMLIVTKGQCDRHSDLINEDFFTALQKVYSGFFLISCIIVLVLYTVTYHSVVTQRRKKLKIRSTTCCFLWDSSGVANGEPSEVTATLELSHVNGEETKVRPDDVTTTGGGGGGGGEESVATSHGVTNNRAPVNRTRIERMRMANIKTALMLFVVTLVFIFSFLPAWLIALKVITAPVIVFYMYFFYNVVNPFIYAFMNQNFRTELKKMFRCKQ